MQVNVRGGTRAGWKTLRMRKRKDWRCPSCRARLRYFWTRCPNCGAERPE